MVDGVRIVGLIAIAAVVGKLLVCAFKLLSWFFAPQPKKVFVELKKEEKEVVLEGYPKFDYKKLVGQKDKVFLFDPSTLDYFGEIPAMSPAEVNEAVAKA